MQGTHPANQTLAHHEPMGKPYVKSTDFAAFRGLTGTTTSIVVGGVTYTYGGNVVFPKENGSGQGSTNQPPGKWAQEVATAFAAAINAAVGDFGVYHSRNVPNSTVFCRVSGTKLIFIGRVPGDDFTVVVTVDDNSNAVTVEFSGDVTAVNLSVDTLNATVDVNLPAITGWGTDQAQTSATGTLYVNLASHSCKQVRIRNDTGTTIDVRNSGGTASPYMLLTGTDVLIPVQANSNEIAIHRHDDGNTQVFVSYIYSDSA
jgi:hypothetical protein